MCGVPLQDPFPVGFGGPAANRSCAVVAAAVAPAGGRSVEFVRPRNGQLGGILDSLGSHRVEALSANGASPAESVCRLVGLTPCASTVPGNERGTGSFQFVAKACSDICRHRHSHAADAWHRRAAGGVPDARRAARAEHPAPHRLPEPGCGRPGAVLSEIAVQSSTGASCGVQDGKTAGVRGTGGDQLPAGGDRNALEVCLKSISDAISCC